MDRPEVEVDEPLMMARYLSASGGLWPHTGYGSISRSTFLVRTSSSPVGSMDAVNPLSQEPEASRSQSLKRLNGQTVGSSGEPLRPTGAAEPAREWEHEDIQHVPDERHSSSAISAALPQKKTEPRRLLTTMSLQPTRGGGMGYGEANTSLGFKPQIRVVDFQVASNEVGQDRPAESPLTPARAAQRSGLSLLLNAPA